jgi:hypothetical protein
VTIFYCLTWDSSNLDGRVPVFISPKNMVAQLYPPALGSIFVAYSVGIKSASTQGTVFKYCYAPLYRVRQANFRFHMAFHIQKRKLACRTLYNLGTVYIEIRRCLARPQQLLYCRVLRWRGAMVVSSRSIILASVSMTQYVTAIDCCHCASCRHLQYLLCVISPHMLAMRYLSFLVSGYISCLRVFP